MNFVALALTVSSLAGMRRRPLYRRKSREGTRPEVSMVV